MAFSRTLAPRGTLAANELTSAMVGIGMAFAAHAPSAEPNVEDTRDRAVDVLTSEALAERHHAYRLRVMIGPTYRADLWAALEESPDISAAELARRTYACFATAWQAKRDFTILRRSVRPRAAGRRSVSPKTRH